MYIYKYIYYIYILYIYIVYYAHLGSSVSFHSMNCFFVLHCVPMQILLLPLSSNIISRTTGQNCGPKNSHRIQLQECEVDI